jgi:hypothetical protein
MGPHGVVVAPSDLARLADQIPCAWRGHSGAAIQIRVKNAAKIYVVSDYSADATQTLVLRTCRAALLASYVVAFHALNAGCEGGTVSRCRTPIHRVGIAKVTSLVSRITVINSSEWF